MRNLYGLEKVVEETKNFDRILKGVYEKTAEEIFGCKNPKGIAVFAYGSPGRIELVGGDSDADVLLVEKERNTNTMRFRKRLKENLSFFDFCKVDLTDWGSYSEIDIFLEKSLVEGNQVLEARYLIGDEEISNDLEEKKRNFDTSERQLENFFFNRLYFNQYFRQRIRNNSLNVKYCHGGSRDFLFFYWYDKFNQFLYGGYPNYPYQPRVKIALSNMFKNGKISFKTLEETLEAVSFLMLLRGDILKINKSTQDKGLTFVDDKTLGRLHSLLDYPLPSEIKKEFEEYRGRISRISNLVLEEMLSLTENLKDKNWSNNFKKALSNLSEEEKINIKDEDNLLKIALIWGASENNQGSFFKYLANKYKESQNWAVICSLVSSPLCPFEILDYFGRGIAKERGYGYILRVIARNKNTSLETLKNIAEDFSLERRYREVAIAALEGGNYAANNQV